MEASASLSNIPIDIIRHILLQSPVKSVIRCQCVCKQWRSLIQDDSDFKLSYRGQKRVIILSDEFDRFVVRSTSHDLRLQRHKWPFGEGYQLIRARNKYFVTLLCYCNGLVLVVTERDLLLWNPSSRCSTKVLERPYPYPESILAGLCYDSCTRDYKAVLVHYRAYGPELVLSASLNHKEWRPIEFPYSCLHSSFKGGVNFRNTFYWWMVSAINQGWDILYWDNKIIYFDPVSDEFRNLSTPELGRENLIVGLGVINDCLCMAQGEDPNSTKTNKIQVFIMKEYGRQESWVTAFAIQTPEFIDRFGRYGDTITFYSLEKDAQEILFHSHPSWHGHQVCVYNWKKDEVKDFLTKAGHGYFVISVCFYVESLACPDHNGLLSE